MDLGGNRLQTNQRCGLKCGVKVVIGSGIKLGQVSISLTDLQKGMAEAFLAVTIRVTA